MSFEKTHVHSSNGSNGLGSSGGSGSRPVRFLGQRSRFSGGGGGSDDIDSSAKSAIGGRPTKTSNGTDAAPTCTITNNGVHSNNCPQMSPPPPAQPSVNVSTHTLDKVKVAKVMLESYYDNLHQQYKERQNR